MHPATCISTFYMVCLCSQCEISFKFKLGFLKLKQSSNTLRSSFHKNKQVVFSQLGVVSQLASFVPDEKTEVRRVVRTHFNDQDDVYIIFVDA